MDVFVLDVRYLRVEPLKGLIQDGGGDQTIDYTVRKRDEHQRNRKNLMKIKSTFYSFIQHKNRNEFEILLFNQANIHCK